ncbi:hypothetical protein BUALT_Bualt13G0093800 [Buddleja alternifolia]|uniref:Smr domain-containing protein n=1 Tax=Buddleja alternifolia TaxID=168488 RepID=A0AAV6WTB8_9LAMI|nr:hypothetical protein BUALT_Bualt13G0093800 [Buddleja alternifolia]
MRQSKKKRSKGCRKGNTENHAAPHKTDNEKEQKVLKNLLEAFASVSLEEATAAYKEANGDPNKAAEILANVVEGAAQEDQSTTCSSSSGNYNVGSSSSSNASDVFGEASDFLQDGFKQQSKPNKSKKKVIASAGTVSTVLGKDYVRSTPKKGSSKLKGFHHETLNKEEAEQFLCSMLGEDCELSLAIVRDVLCQCGYNLEKALDAVLELSASSKERANGCNESTIREDAPYLTESTDDLTDSHRSSESTSRSSEIELQDNLWLTGNLFRNLSEVPESSETRYSTKTGNSEFELPQKVLECLFNMPTPKTAEHEPNTMNWRNIVKQITSLGQRSEPGDSEQGQLIHAKGDEYQVLREDAKQHWGSMKSYYQKATTAFSNGEKEYAAYLSEKGRTHSKRAREADAKASQDIFAVRNRTIENMITIDLHGQHIKQAMRLLKLHLLFGAYVQSVRSFRVITGCGSHGVGKSKLKNSVINLLQKEGISWSEENRGTLLIRLEGRMNFSFLDSGSDSE